jgi:hypothetical protein
MARANQSVLSIPRRPAVTSCRTNSGLGSRALLSPDLDGQSNVSALLQDEDDVEILVRVTRDRRSCAGSPHGVLRARGPYGPSCSSKSEGCHWSTSYHIWQNPISQYVTLVRMAWWWGELFSWWISTRRLLQLSRHSSITGLRRSWSTTNHWSDSSDVLSQISDPTPTH